MIGFRSLETLLLVFFLPRTDFSLKPSFIVEKPRGGSLVEEPPLDINGGTFHSSIPKGL